MHRCRLSRKAGFTFFCPKRRDTDHTLCRRKHCGIFCPTVPTFNEETFFGVVLSKTGGIVIDDWIRIYGSGKYDFYKKNTSLSEWGAMIIAEDIVGGLFSLDNNGIINYFAPDSLQWESLDITYSQFIHWAMIKERVDKYYETFRWDGWAEDSAMLSSTQGMIFFIFLWEYS